MKLRGYPINEAIAALDRINSMGRDEFLDWQRKQAWKMAAFHYQYNDVYREKVGRYFPKNWDDLPIVTKKDLQKPISGLISKGIKLKQCYFGSTSGSSGQPFFFVKDKLAHAMTWAVIRHRYSHYGIGLHHKQARFYGIPKEPAAYWKEKVKDGLMNRVRFPVFDLSDEVMQDFLKRFSKNKFRYLYGYTSSLVLFARYLMRQGVVLRQQCPSISLCISTSETCTPEDHSLLEQAFGIRHVREYGASETCMMAFDMPDGNWSLTEETVLLELLGDSGQEPAEGEDGEIHCTSLFNRALPMIRYQIGDRGVVVGAEANGRYRSLKLLTGRTNDVIVLPNGKKAAGLTFYYVSRSILENGGLLDEFIIRQTTPSHFIFDIVAHRELTASEVRQIEEKSKSYLNANITVEINKVPHIERPASGKLKHFYSEL